MERLRSFLTNEYHANLVLRFAFSNDSAMVVGQARESFNSQHAQPATRADGRIWLSLSVNSFRPPPDFATSE
ncbi:MAG: hypothetical protein JWQ17_791 [Tardiphaga sp.]|nr:hypothetical protein [Tardiphaga sp.]